MLRVAIEAVSLHPVDVPRRSTAIRVQWKSGAKSELSIERPARGEWRRTPPKTVERIRALASAGRRDEEIAERLNQENIPTASGQRWSAAAVTWARRRNEIPRTAPEKPRNLPLPERHPDGRYSVRGAARRFDTSETVVRGWIERGMVPATREDYRGHRGVWWLCIDEQTAIRLEQAAQRSRQRARRRR